MSEACGAADEVTQGIATEGARDAGFDPAGLRRAFGILETWTERGVVPGAAALVARGGLIAGEAYVGLAHRAEQRRVTSETIWSLASITKPVTALAVLLLVERGRFALDEPVVDLLPEFADAPQTPFDRRAVTVRHLLSHCSGLPGFAPDNLDLRRAHRPLEDFVRSFLRQPLLFVPGTLHYYSNPAILAAAEIAGRALAGTLRRHVENPAVGHYHPFVHKQILAPLGMTGSALRPPPEWDERIALVEDTGQAREDWEIANTAYYRGLGIPWGGLFSRPRDLVRFVDLFLPDAGGRQRIGVMDPHRAPRIASPATVRAMTTVQCAPPDAPADLAPDLRDGDPPTIIRPRVEWGIGWEIKGTKPLHPAGDLTSPATLAHGGSTGTFVWADPATDTVCVLLTNRAMASGWTCERPYQALFANAILAAAR